MQSCLGQGGLCGGLCLFSHADPTPFFTRLRSLLAPHRRRGRTEQGRRHLLFADQPSLQRLGLVASAAGRAGDRLPRGQVRHVPRLRLLHGQAGRSVCVGGSVVVHACSLVCRGCVWKRTGVMSWGSVHPPTNNANPTQPPSQKQNRWRSSPSNCRPAPSSPWSSTGWSGSRGTPAALSPSSSPCF